MAIFEGSSAGFNEFIGPVARNIVCNMSRKYKKNTTCRHEGCNKRKPLEAAHIKGKERPIIIAGILECFQKDDQEDWFVVDLIEFKSLFIAAHQPIEDVILPMCKEHHLAYDKLQNIQSEYPILLNEFVTEEGEELYSEEELATLEANDSLLLKETVLNANVNSIKLELQAKYNLKKSQIAYARISDANGLWNFDVSKKKFLNDFFFVFYDQNNKQYKVAFLKANSLNTERFPEKNPEAIRFFVDKEFMDRSGFNFRAYFKE